MTELLSVVIPAHNEGASLPETIRNILDFRPSNFNLELILVNDASTDDTLSVAERLQNEYPGVIKVESHQNQGGLGASLNSGFAIARGDILTWLPGDSEFSFEDIALGIEKLEKADMVLFTRTSRGQMHRGIISAVMHLLIRFLFRADLRNYSGIFLIKKENWELIRTDSKSTIFAIEVALSAVKRNFKIVWMNATWTARVSGKSSVFRPTVIVSSFWDLMRMLTLKSSHDPNRPD